MLVFIQVFCLLVSTLGYVYLRYLQWNSDYWRERHFDGPSPDLWNGSFCKTSTGKCNIIEELDEFYRQYKSSHSYIGVHSARIPKLFILDPMLAKQILTTNFKNFHDNESSKWTTSKVDPLRTQSPFVSTGEQWKEKRSEIVPVLTPGRLRTFHPVLQESADKLINFIKGHVKESLDAKELINRYTADFMSSFIWGIQSNTDAFSTEDGGSFSDIQKMANMMIEQALHCVRYYGRTVNFPWLRQWFPVRFFSPVSDNFFQQLASYAIEMRSSNVHEGDQQQQYDVINHLLQLRSKKSLNEIQIAGHTTTILIDGFESGAIVSAHLLLLLARYPRVQQKLREELLSAVDEKCSYDELNSLVYLDQCVNETLRLFPPLTLLSKLCTESLRLENKDGTNLLLETGMSVYISSYSFQHDSDYYEQPEVFWPERFDAEMGGVRKYQEMGVFLPFGDGPRVCPGLKLGVAEVKMAVARIVRKFQITPSEKMRSDNQIEPDSFLLALKDGIHLVFEEI